MQQERTYAQAARVAGRIESVHDVHWSKDVSTLSIGLNPADNPIAEICRSISARSSRVPNVQETFSARRLTQTLKQTSTSGFVSLPMLLADVVALVATCVISGFAVSRLVFLSLHDLETISFSLALPLLMGNLLAALYPGVALNPVVEFRQLSRVAAISFLGVTSVALLGRLGVGTYLFLAFAAFLQFTLAPLCRSWMRSLCSGQSWWGYPVMVFGSGEASKTVMLNLIEHPEYGLRPAIMLDPAAKVRSSMGVPVTDRLRLTSALAKRLNIRHAIVVLPDLSPELVTRIVEHHAKSIRHVMRTSAISPLSAGLPILWRDTRDLAGVAGVEVRNRLLVPTPRLIKRSMDILLTVAGGLCALPLLGIILLLVKLTSRGPIFYAHTRIGERGATFSAWKFRSMVTNGEDILSAHLAADADARDEWERDRKLKNDPRLTPVGSFLRKTSLDELPQLWNVLKGDMSLVGPRPIVKAEIKKYGKCYKIYKAVRPGITGLWQVSGRNNTTYEERLRHDEFYVRNWSPWLDMHILARTVSTLLCGRGAY